MSVPIGKFDAGRATAVGIAFLLFLSVVLVVVPPAVHASTVISITTSNGATVCPEGFPPGLGGTWDSSTDTCSNAGGFSFPSGYTVDIGAGVTVTGTSGSGDGIENGATIDNYGTMTGTSGGSGTGDGIGNANSGIINNEGSMTGNGDGADGILNSGIINNEGSVSWDSDSIINSGTINNYCGVTLSSGGYFGTSPNAISCYAVTFDQSGLPSGATWGVTAHWGPFTLPVDHTTGGSSVSIQATGSLTYSYDSPVTYSGSTYDCSTGCSGAPTVSGVTSFSGSYSLSPPTSHLPPIPPGAAPDDLNITTYGGSPISGRLVSLDGAYATYNFPTINQTLLNQELAQGSFALLPDTVSVCTAQLYGQNFIRVSGFFSAWWGGGLTNSTEFVFGDYQSFITSAQGWPTEPACNA